MQNKNKNGRNVALALAIAGLPSALVSRWSAPVSEHHCVRERATDLSGSWDTTSGGSSPLSNRSERLFHAEKYIPRLPCGEKRSRVFPGVAFKVLLHLGGGLAAPFVVAIGQCVINGCSRRIWASCCTAEARPRRRGGGVLRWTILRCCIRPLSPGISRVDRAAAILTPDDDHHVNLVPGANAGRGQWTVTPGASVISCLRAVSTDSRRDPAVTSSQASSMKDDGCSKLTATDMFGAA